jgi:hypothetical protein
MTTKICFKCNIEKPLSDYYKHKAMGDGYLGKCKDCTKKDTKERADVLIQDPEWKEKEQARHREKYYRLDYKEKHKPTPEMKKAAMAKYKNKYPEKVFATSATSKMKPIIKGNQLHHWSYNEQHRKDVIELTVKQHEKAHRFMIYDQEQMMYRRTDNNELLDTKESHSEWIFWCIENKAD